MKINTKALVPVALIALGMTWGSAFILMKVLVDEISPTQIVAGRLTLGAALVLAVLLVQRRAALPAPGLILSATLLSVVDHLIPNTLVAWSETRIDGGLASVLMSTMPLFTVVFAMTVLKEGGSTIRVVGLALGFIGVIIASDGDVLAVGSDNGLAMVAVVSAAISHSVAAIYTKMLLKRHEALPLIAGKLSAGALLTAPTVLATQGAAGFTSMSIEAALCLLALGAVATGVAYGVYIWVVGKAGAVQASLVTYIIPVFGLLMAWLVLGESIGPTTIAGAATIVLGVAVAMYGPSVKLPRPRSMGRSLPALPIRGEGTVS